MNTTTKKETIVLKLMREVLGFDQNSFVYGLAEQDKKFELECSKFIGAFNRAKLSFEKESAARYAQSAKK